jgi:hypothetical protein
MQRSSKCFVKLVSSKVKELVVTETQGLQRSSSRVLTSEDVTMQVFVNIYEPGLATLSQRSRAETLKGKKRKRTEKVKTEEGRSGFETHTDSSGAAALVTSLTGDGNKPGLYILDS